jgi:hypothetical protein
MIAQARAWGTIAQPDTIRHNIAAFVPSCLRGEKLAGRAPGTTATRISNDSPRRIRGDRAFHHEDTKTRSSPHSLDRPSTSPLPSRSEKPTQRLASTASNPKSF